MKNRKKELIKLIESTDSFEALKMLVDSCKEFDLIDPDYFNDNGSLKTTMLNLIN